jgi:hypothetical protein
VEYFRAIAEGHPQAPVAGGIDSINAEHAEDGSRSQGRRSSQLCKMPRPWRIRSGANR